jgi:hypothetical protein
MTTPRQEELFKKIVADEFPKSLLGSCIDWIRDSLNPDQVFEMAALKKFMSETVNCEEVFSNEELGKWAEANGYMKISAYPTEVAAKISQFVNGEAGRDVISDHQILPLLKSA